jgi:hypothetical protein
VDGGPRRRKSGKTEAPGREGFGAGDDTSSYRGKKESGLAAAAPPGAELPFSRMDLGKKDSREETMVWATTMTWLNQDHALELNRVSHEPEDGSALSPGGNESFSFPLSDLPLFDSSKMDLVPI